jgi:shikimate dehydrogenase
LTAFTPVKDKGALILGTGGASKAAAYVMKKWNLDYQFVSRNPSAENEIYYSDMTEDMLKDKQLIIQTTPLGMKPNIETCPPIPFEYLNEQHFLFDMVYNPEKTIFLSAGMERGCKGMNGQMMFQFQAEKAWSIWKQKI